VSVALADGQVAGPLHQEFAPVPLWKAAQDDQPLPASTGFDIPSVYFNFD
jgi:hypothetical protein